MPSLSSIANLLGCPMPADSVEIIGVATLEDAGPADLSFVGSDSYVAKLADTKAAAIFVQKRVKLPETWTRPALVV